VKPSPLRPGARIGIIAPAGATSSQKSIRALANFTEGGYDWVCGQSVMQQHGYLAGHDEVRLADLMEMFNRPDIDAIFCMRGGYGSMRLLDHIDYETIRQNPKPFVGYSDITALLIALYQQCGLHTFHGPMVFEWADKEPGEDWQLLFDMLSGCAPYPCYQADDSFLCITPGQASGRLVGGNLTLLTATLGTPYEVETEDCLLFLEEVNEPLYAIDRMLTQLLLSGKLEACQGILFTSCHRCYADKPKQTLSLEKIFMERLAPLQIPCFYGLSVGHVKPNFPLPIGYQATMDASCGVLQIDERIPS
jgi:muramoyltetrapeptide carboxypeptidase